MGVEAYNVSRLIRAGLALSVRFGGESWEGFLFCSAHKTLKKHINEQFATAEYKQGRDTVRMWNVGTEIILYCKSNTNWSLKGKFTTTCPISVDRCSQFKQ